MIGNLVSVLVAAIVVLILAAVIFIGVALGVLLFLGAVAAVKLGFRILGILRGKGGKK